MQRFKRILLYAAGTLGDQAAFDRARDLATRNRAHLTVVGILDESPGEALEPTEQPASSGVLQPTTTQGLLESLQALTAPCQTPGDATEVKVLRGTPFIEIIREVMQARHDLVMLADESVGLGRFFGNTSLRLMRKCPCPVWVIKPGQHRRFQRIMAAVDPAPGDACRTEVNGKIMDFAVSLARLEDARLHIVHVCDTAEVAALPGAGVALALRQIEDMHRQRLDDLVHRGDLTAIAHESHLLMGLPADGIGHFASEHAVDLLVMGTLARTGMAGLLIGNTAEEVLRRVNCSVLTLKPEGFVTPVKRREP